MELLPERLRLESDAGAEQRRMERPFRGRLLDRGPLLTWMMVTMMTIIVVAVVARFHVADGEIGFAE